MKIIVSPRKLPQYIVKQIEQVHKDIKLIATEDNDILEEYWPKAEIIFSGKIKADTLAKCKNLRWIQETSAGIERYFYPEFLKRDIILTNVRGMHGQTISEHIFMMMLAHTRQLKKYIHQQQNHTWKKHEIDEVRLLQNKVLLIIGLGGIGQKTAQIATAFGMRVEGIANTPKNLPYVKKTYVPDMLKQALPTADFIVISVPLTEKTKGMISTAEFSLMKRDAFMVNIGRGLLIDQQAMIKALKEGEIGGAGLDVFSNEPLEEDSPLWDMENVIITPHMAGHMPDYLGEATKIFCSNLLCYLEGRELINLVDKKAGY
jgi:D-2-hydroxyacid dehydrogenase (NADP+)